MAKKNKSVEQSSPQTLRWIFAFNKRGSNYYTTEDRPYKKSIDADRKAAPVGYRWSQYAIEKGYAKSTSTKPSAADIEMYAGKKKNGKLLIYRETRSNKSDVTPKKKI
jgi:hypothetical protein